MATVKAKNLSDWARVHLSNVPGGIPKNIPDRLVGLVSRLVCLDYEWDESGKQSGPTAEEMTAYLMACFQLPPKASKDDVIQASIRANIPFRESRPVRKKKKPAADPTPPAKTASYDRLDDESVRQALGVPSEENDALPPGIITLSLADHVDCPFSPCPKNVPARFVEWASKYVARADMVRCADVDNRPAKFTAAFLMTKGLDFEGTELDFLRVCRQHFALTTAGRNTLDTLEAEMALLRELELAGGEDPARKPQKKRGETRGRPLNKAIDRDSDNLILRAYSATDRPTPKVVAARLSMDLEVVYAALRRARSECRRKHPQYSPEVFIAYCKTRAKRTTQTTD